MVYANEEDYHEAGYPLTLKLLSRLLFGQAAGCHQTEVIHLWKIHIGLGAALEVVHRERIVAVDEMEETHQEIDIGIRSVYLVRGRGQSQGVFRVAHFQQQGGQICQRNVKLLIRHVAESLPEAFDSVRRPAVTPPVQSRQRVKQPRRPNFLCFSTRQSIQSITILFIYATEWY